MKKEFCKLILSLFKDTLNEDEQEILKVYMESAKKFVLFYEQILKNKMVFHFLRHIEQLQLFYKLPGFYRRELVNHIIITDQKSQRYKNLVAELHQSGLLYCILKGKSLEDRIYNEQLKRDYNDIDLLVDIDDIESWKKQLQSMGFKQQHIASGNCISEITRKEYLECIITSHQLFPFSRKNENTMICNYDWDIIDVNFSIFFGGQVQDPIPSKKLLLNRKLYQQNNIQYYTLSEEDELIQLIVHFYKDTIYEIKKKARKSFCLNNLWEISKFINDVMSIESRQKFVKRVLEYNLKKYVELCCQIIDVLFGGAVKEINVALKIDDFDRVALLNYVYMHMIE